jgi:hypothetical protein
VTGQEYAELCTACDRLLRASGAGLERLAIPMLHLINEHPSILRQYTPLLEGARQDRSMRVSAISARALARVARALLWTARQPEVLLEPRPAHSRATALIVSHLSNPSQLQPESDSYFGSLQQRLRERGVESLLVFVDHLRCRTDRALCREKLRLGQNRLLPRYVSAGEEAAIWRRCRLAAEHLRQEALEAPNRLERTLATVAAHQVQLGITATNLRLHAVIRRVCNRLRPDMVITTHEGDACERVIWHAARTVAPPPLCVGYQHSRMLQRSHAIRRSIGHGAHCDPDVILTLGETPQAVLASSPQLQSVRLITYGTHRRATSAAEYRSGAGQPRRCVVLPDADESEFTILMEFAVDCARRCPDVDFVLRPHPVTDFAALCARHPKLRSLPVNMSLSNATTLEQDCLRSRNCLYRGSSAAMQAVLWGLKPFYVARPDELPFDPLFFLDGWREMISSPEQFLECVQRSPTASDQAAARRAWDQCDRYIAPVRPAAIDELLQLIER